MIRTSIRSTLRKYRIESDFIDQDSHHKMMRKEVAMNIFPFGADGTDPSLVIRAVRWFYFYFYIYLYKIHFCSDDFPDWSSGAGDQADPLGLVDFWKFWIRAAALRTPSKSQGGRKCALFHRIIQRKFLNYYKSKDHIVNTQCWVVWYYVALGTFNIN